MRLLLQDPPHPVLVYEFTALWLSVRLSGDQACLDSIVLGNLLRAFMRGYQLQDPPHPVLVYEFTCLWLSVRLSDDQACVDSILLWESC